MSRGFTLVEVLVALAVVGIAMLALMSSAGHYTRQSAELRDRMIAGWVASDRLTRYRLARVFPDASVDSGEVEQYGRSWVWTAVITPAPGEDDLRRIDVSVARAEAPDATVVLLTGFVGRPGVRAP
jgi:general secretion pathway protein I